MTPYFAWMFVPILFHLVSRPNALNYTAVFLLYWLFVGFRYEVGPDWDAYVLHFDTVHSLDWGSIWTSKEPGYWSLLKVLSELGWGVISLNLIAAGIFLFGVFIFARTTRSPWIAIAVASSYCILILGMSGIRQGMAMGFIFFVLARWRKASVFEKLSWIFTASLFHASALFLLALLAFGKETSRLVKIVGVLLVFVGIYLVGRNELQEIYGEYADIYTGDTEVIAPGAFLHALLIAAPASIYLLFRQRWERVWGHDRLLFVLSVASICLLPAVAISTVGVSRMSLYLTPVAMTIWASVPLVFGSKRSAMIFGLGVNSVQLLTMFVWLSFASNAFMYYPYKNIIFGD